MPKKTSITELLPDTKNPNKHTQRGMGMLEDSIQECGFGDSLTVDRNGRIISGNARAEVLVSVGMEDAVVVQSDGTKPIIHQRTDLDLENDTDHRARRLSLQLNRIHEADLEWNAGILAELAQDGVELSDLWSTEEMDALLLSSQMPESEEWPDVNENAQHQITIHYDLSDEPILKTFCRQDDDLPLAPKDSGRRVLERIKEIVAPDANPE
jgi:hypothetical protein